MAVRIRIACVPTIRIDPDADEPRKSAAGWNLHPGRPPLTPTALPKLDAEAELGTEDTGWLRACLTDSRYPRAVR